jgi:large subunit ribosomal protein L21
MYVIIKIGSKQYRVSEGDVIHVDLMGEDAGKAVEFKEVLFMYDGKEHHMGLPGIAGAMVKGEVLGETYGEKIRSVKYKQRKRQPHRFGHRQRYTKVKITEIAKESKHGGANGS